MDNRERDSSALHQLPGDTDTAELYNRLHFGDDPAIRKRAAEILGNLADSAEEYEERKLIKELIKRVLSNDEDSVRARAIDSIYLHGEENVDTLIGELARAVKQDNGDVTGFFLNWLDAEHAEFRMVAASAVRKFGDESVIPSLEAKFEDADERVQARAVRAYSQFGSAASAAPIKPLLKSRNARVRRAAADALGTIGTDGALRTLLPAARARDERLRRTAVKELHQLDREQTATVLLRSLSDTDDAVQKQAMISLIQLFVSGEAVTAEDIRHSLIEKANEELLTELGGVLREILDEPVGEDVRRYAVWLLGSIAERLQKADVRQLLVDCLDDSDGVVADTAAASLHQQVDPQLEKQLQLFIQKDETSPVGKERANAILEQINRDMAASIEDKSIKYTYVSDPADYTKKRNQEHR